MRFVRWAGAVHPLGGMARNLVVCGKGGGHGAAWRLPDGRCGAFGASALVQQVRGGVVHEPDRGRVWPDQGCRERWGGGVVRLQHGA